MAELSDHLELLAVLMMDVRATVESQRRAVTNAQSSIEQLRHTRALAQVADIKDCIEQILKESAVITETISHTKKPLAELEAHCEQDGDKPTGTYTDRRRNPR